ncbi:uncharacterized protein [Palaemon carinicauda]|uniref:uncharacterized protein n=1 Tax=Palaemon carinicauda TaxID=392227 RepID=UPI0035B6636C
MASSPGRECIKQVCPEDEVLDGHLEVSPGSGKKRRLDGLIRPPGHLFSHPNSSELYALSKRHQSLSVSRRLASQSSLIRSLPEGSLNNFDLVLRKNWVSLSTRKSLLIPSQEILYLGMVIRSRVFRAFPSPLRTEQANLKLRSFLGKRKCSARKWMSPIGTLSSLEQFVSLGRLNLRPLQFHLNHHWDKEKDLETMNIPITESLKSCLRWWNEPDRFQEGYHLVPKNPDLVLCSDASDTGWGATLGKLEVSGLWLETRKNFHINQKELLAVLLALRSFEWSVLNKVVQVNADNTTALDYIAKQGGTHSMSLYETAMSLLLSAKERNVVLMIRFIQGERNVMADSLSRRGQILSTEWTLNQQVCKSLWQLWGRPCIDLFATSKTKRLEMYCSLVPDLEAVH